MTNSANGNVDGNGNGNGNGNADSSINSNINSNTNSNTNKQIINHRSREEVNGAIQNVLSMQRRLNKNQKKITINRIEEENKNENPVRNPQSQPQPQPQPQLEEDNDDDGNDDNNDDGNDNGQKDDNHCYQRNQFLFTKFGLGDISYSSEDDRYAAVSHKPTYEEASLNTNSHDKAPSPNFNHNDNRNDVVQARSSDWIPTRNQDFLMEWNQQERDPNIDDTYAYGSLEARSSVSSPGKTGLRQKLQYRLLKRDQISKTPLPSFQTDQDVSFSEGKEDSISDHTNQDHDNTLALLTLQKINLSLSDATSDPISPHSPASNPPPPPPIPPPTSRQKSPNKSPTSGPSIKYPKLSKHHAQEKPRDNQNASLLRLSRTVRYGRRGEMPGTPTKQGNIIRLHVYDLICNDTMMQLPFGCEFPIGRAFQAMNNGLHAMGTGVYHCGIEVNGVEYAYGANEIVGSTGVFTCVPRLSPGYQYRSTIDFGKRSLIKRSWVNVQLCSGGLNKVPVSTYKEIEHSVNGRDIMKEMALEYKGTDYDLLRKNCCTFAKDACLRLGVNENEIPTWFMNLAKAGATTQDGMQKTLDALTPKLDQRRKEVLHIVDSEPFGFEVIPNRGCIEVVRVVEAVQNQAPSGSGSKKISVRRTLSWTY